MAYEEPPSQTSQPTPVEESINHSTVQNASVLKGSMVPSGGDGRGADPLQGGAVLEEQLPHDDLLRGMILQSDWNEPVDINGPEAKKTATPAIVKKKSAAAEGEPDQ